MGGGSIFKLVFGFVVSVKSYYFNLFFVEYLMFGVDLCFLKVEFRFFGKIYGGFNFRFFFKVVISKF